MPIVTSIFKRDPSPQDNGDWYITEYHTDTRGGVHCVVYRATAGAGADDMYLADQMAARVLEINAQLAETECAETVEKVLAGADLMTMTFVDTTRQAVSQRLFRVVASDPNPKNVLAVTPLMGTLKTMHPTEQDQADFLGIHLETMRSANARFAALAAIGAVLSGDTPVEV